MKVTNPRFLAAEDSAEEGESLFPHYIGDNFEQKLKSFQLENCYGNARAI